MTDSPVTRRDWLKTAALATTPVLLGALPAAADTAVPTPPAGKTPALTTGEIAAIEAAMGKKGTYVEAQATHTTSLPRNDLKVTIKGEAVPEWWMLAVAFATILSGMASAYWVPRRRL